MLKSRKIAVMGVAALGAICASASFAQSRPIAFDASARQAIKRIDVLDVAEPPVLVMPTTGAVYATAKKTDVQVANAQPAIDAAGAASEKLKAGFSKQGTSLSKDMARQLVDALKAKGYDARLLTGQHLKIKNGGGLDDSAITSDADAVLDVRVRSAGYVSQHGVQGIMPLVSAEATLIPLKDHKTVYRQTFASGASLGPIGQSQSLSAPQGRKFASRDDVLGNVDSGVEGLREAVGIVASRVADQLGQ